MRTITSLLVAVAGTACGPKLMAAEIPAEQRPALVQRVLGAFWDGARDSSGQPFVPATPAERETVPVSTAWTDLAIDTGEVSGRLGWCNLNWRVTFQALTTRARGERLSEKQVAFLSVLHGAAQATVAAAVAASVCGETEKAQVIERGRGIVARLARAGN